jgi:cell division protein FtsI/penicillin-binding protein 2
MTNAQMKKKGYHIENCGKEIFSARITIVAALFIFLAVLICCKLFYLQILNNGYFQKIVNSQRDSSNKIEPSRGLIFVKDKSEASVAIADNKKMYLLFAIPARIENATATAEKIESVLKFNDDEKKKIISQLNKYNDPYEPIRHYVLEDEKNKILDFKIDGLDFFPETKRYYPEKNIFSHITGFVGFVENSQVGSYGLEEAFEKYLRGFEGEISLEKDPGGRPITVGDFDIKSAVNGSDLYLTIDRQVQYKSCFVLSDTIKKFGAEGGVVIVQDPNTGAILALCDSPDFDPNNYGQVENSSYYTNQAVSSLYEPGSIFKAITMAGALDSGGVLPETTYEDKGVLNFGKDNVKNAADKVYGNMNMMNVLEYSINTGAVFAAESIGLEKFKEYVKKFGFGEKTEIEMPSEAKGDILALNKKSPIYLATASFGQGISATPIQMINAFSAIANGGILYKPYIVEKIIDSDGKTEIYKSKQIRRVISEKTANVLKAMLVSVIDNGHGKPAGVSGYFVGGKTGTAQIPSPNGGYLNSFNHSFVGFAPAISTRFVVFVKITNPKMRFAESTAAPAFAEIMNFLLNYYQVPTER